DRRVGAADDPFADTDKEITVQKLAHQCRRATALEFREEFAVESVRQRAGKMRRVDCARRETGLSDPMQLAEKGFIPEAVDDDVTDAIERGTRIGKRSITDRESRAVER